MASIKDKIASVRSVVSDRSNDEIVLVLQHHDNDVQKTIAEFLDGGNADDILTEWTHAGSNKASKAAKKRKNKKKAKQAKALAAANAQNNEETNTPKLMNGHNEIEEAKSEQNEVETAAALKQLLTNQKADNFKENDKTNSVQLSSQPPPVINGTDGGEAHTAEVAKAIKQQQYLYHGGRRSRTSSESSTRAANKKKQKHQQSSLAAGNQQDDSGQARYTEGAASSNKKSIEKAVKDLNRCTVSYGRYKNLLNAEIQDSYKRIKQVFQELSDALMDREVALIRELDEMKDAAFELMAKRETQAHELKRQTDRVDAMNHQQLNDLRGEIKHFVAERKFDEELGRTSRFVFDRDVLTKVIPSIGEITGIKNSYTPRNRTESAASYTSDSGIAAARAIPAKEAPTPSPQTKPPSAPSKTHKQPSTAKSNTLKSPPSKLPIADPIQPATSSQPKASQTKAAASPTTAPVSSDDKGKDVANGHVEDWAAEASDLPLPESPASWASKTPIMTPDGTFKDVSNPQPQRVPRRDRQQKASSSTDKDKNLMPPPIKIPPAKSSGSNPSFEKHDSSQINSQTFSNSSNQRGYKNADYNKGSGDGAQFHDRPRGRGRGGFYRGNRGGPTRGNYHGPPRGGYQGNGERQNDVGPRPNSGQYRNDRGGGRQYDRRPQRGQYVGGPNRKFNDGDARSAKYGKPDGQGSGHKSTQPSAAEGTKQNATSKETPAAKSE